MSTTLLRIEFESAILQFGVFHLPARPQALNIRQTLVTNKSASYANKCHCNAAKVAPNTKRHPH